MKRILGITATTIGIAATVLAGLVADNGIGITTTSTEPTVADTVAPIEAQDAPPAGVPGAPTKPEEAAPLAEKDATRVPVAKEASDETAEVNAPPQDVVSEPEKAALDSLEDDAANDAMVVKAPTACEATGPSPHGERSFFVAAGRNRTTVEAIALGLEFFSANRWFEDGNWYCVPYLELLASYWESDPNTGHTGVSSLHEGGISTYIRCIRKQQPGGIVRPYADGGLGLHYLTEDRIEGKELGRQWLAGSNVGIGLVLGKSERLDVGLRIRHLSNAGTRDINWGINHFMVRVAVRF